MTTDSIQANESSDIIFLDDVDEAPVIQRDPWRIMIVDDEPSIHSVTRLALDGFTFEGRPLELINAFSAKEARAHFARLTDIAVVLLDVVMENEQSGLDLVRYIRDELGDHRVRIVLRTGQPGQAPERHVIAHYDINDYKEKTDLTAQRLFSLMFTSLRAYRDAIFLDFNRHALRRVASMANGFASKEGAAAFIIAVAQYFDQIREFSPDYAVIHTPPRPEIEPKGIEPKGTASTSTAYPNLASGLANEASGASEASEARLERGLEAYEVVSATGRFQGILSGAKVMALDAEDLRRRIRTCLDALEQNQESDGMAAGVMLPSGRKVMLLADITDQARAGPGAEIIQGALESAAMAIEAADRERIRVEARDEAFMLLAEAAVKSAENDGIYIDIPRLRARDEGMSPPLPNTASDSDLAVQRVLERASKLPDSEEKTALVDALKRMLMH